jgi:SNF2 family DNA or RNA helicase
VGKFLPPKTVNVVFCGPTPFQAEIYSREAERVLSRLEPGSHLAAIANLKKICSSPLLAEGTEPSGITHNILKPKYFKYFKTQIF